MKDVFMILMAAIPVERAVELNREGYEFTVLNDGYVLITKGGIE